MSERVYVYPIASNHGTRYKAEVRTGTARIYLGTFDAPDFARAAADHFIATCEKPPKGKRGPRGKQAQLRYALAPCEQTRAVASGAIGAAEAELACFRSKIREAVTIP